MKKICFIGASTIGSIYGVVFKLAGHSVSFYCRPESLKKYSTPLTCQIINKHNIIPKGYIYQRQLFSDSNRFDDFELIIVCVRHYQLTEILSLLNRTKKAHILFFCNNWSELAPFYQTLTHERVFFGMPRAGGNITEESLLNGGLFEEVILGRSSAAFYPDLLDLFDSIQLKPTQIDDMQSWYWIHMASTVAWITGAAKTGGFIRFSRSWLALKHAVLVGREAVSVAVKRGAKMTACKDANVFKLPSAIAATILWCMMRKPIIQAISKGHATPDDLKAVCYDVLNTANKLNYHTPLLQQAVPFVKRIK